MSSSSSSSFGSEDGSAKYVVNFNDRLGGGEQMDVVDDFKNIGTAPQPTSGPNFDAIFPRAQSVILVDLDLDARQADVGPSTVEDEFDQPTGRDDLNPSTPVG